MNTQVRLPVADFCRVCLAHAKSGKLIASAPPTYADAKQDRPHGLSLWLAAVCWRQGTSLLTIATSGLVRGHSPMDTSRCIEGVTVACHLGEQHPGTATRGASVGASVAWLVASNVWFRSRTWPPADQAHSCFSCAHSLTGSFGTEPSSMAVAHIPLSASICTAQRHCSRSRAPSVRTCYRSGCTATRSRDLTVQYKRDNHKSQLPRRRDVTSGFGRRRVPTRVHPCGVRSGRPVRGAAQPTSWRRP